MQRPALMLPMGEGDWSEGSRWQFLKDCAPGLEKIGWCIGIEAKGSSLGGWARECFPRIKEMGGRITMHPPNNTAWKLGSLDEPIPDKLLSLAQQIPEFRKLGLEAVTIHCAPVLAGKEQEPPADAGLERYFSPISAEEMLAHIKRQVQPLRDVNEMMAGILQIENVDITNFCKNGTKVPTFTQLQTGCFLDLRWLKSQAGVRTTFDIEHFLCASNLLIVSQRENQAGFDKLPILVSSQTEDEREFQEITGYCLAKGWPPKAIREPSLEGYIRAIEPLLFHLGGATRAVDENGRIATHQPIDAELLFNPASRAALDLQLSWINGHPEVIGAVIEVTGKLDPDRYSEWSPRIADDEEAKRTTYLTVMDEIARL